MKKAVKKKIRKRRVKAERERDQKGQLGWLMLALRCPLSRVVIRRIFKVLLVAAPPLPFEPKQTECSVFFRQVARAREREGGRNGLCFRFQLEDQGMGVDGSERNAEVQWGKEREREGGADKRKERKKKRRESSRDHARVLRGKKNFLPAFFFLSFFFFLPNAYSYKVQCPSNSLYFV